MRKKLKIEVFAFHFFLIFLAGSLAFAKGPKAPPPSTDDQLRDSLNSRTDDDYDRQLLGDPVRLDGKSRVDEEMRKKLERELGPAAQEEGNPKDPLRQAAEAMLETQPRLGQLDSGAVTQSLQRQIVADLAELIERAKKLGSHGGGRSNGRKSAGGGRSAAPQPGQTAGNSPSAARESKPEIRKPEEILAENREKARRQMIDLFDPKLQQRERQHVLELPNECFLPEYELEIEDYFRRLSQDQPDAGKP